ncbi:O-methyltransferase [Bacillus sp. 2205SS5-2]|uniref:O-methyltransferase n=1 Tax=Bacillus sp. 2205SS5-2 TaxID=3109031 RepID=UPI00300430C7
MSNLSVWTKVDDYFSEELIGEDVVMEGILEANQAANLPAIDVSPNQGKFLNLLAKVKGAKRILEIGTLGGYSTTWLARALPVEGQLVTLEYSEKHAKVATENLKNAGVDHLVNIFVGPALDTLPTLADKGFSSFDLIFIDADKVNNPQYVKWGIELAKPGAIMIVDNVTRGGRVLDSSSEDESVQGVRNCLELLKSDPRIDSTAIQTVGAKGYDGFVMGIVQK